MKKTTTRRLTADELAECWPDAQESYPELRAAWGDDPWPYVGEARPGEWRGLMTALALAVLVLAGIVGMALL